MKVIQIVLREVMHKLHSLDNPYVFVLLRNGFNLLAELIHNGESVKRISSPDGSYANNRNFLAVDTDERLVVLLNRSHIGVSVLIGTESHNNLVGSVSVHLHKGILVVNISADSLVQNIVIKNSVGHTYVSAGRSQWTVALSDGVSEPKNLLILLCPYNLTLRYNSLPTKVYYAIIGVR